MNPTDELEIRNLVARYSDAVNRRDAEAWGATWAEDGCWRILDFAPQGRAAIVALWQELMQGFPFVVQMPSDGVVEGSDEAATARFYLTEYGCGADGVGRLTLGVYHDRFCRTPEGWRFLERRFEVLHSVAPNLSDAISKPQA